ncbi:MAG: HNH endonuclease [Pseudomonadota bacterium]
MKKINPLLFNQGNKCFYCNAVLDINEATIDHVIPRAKGGTDDIDNLVVCCKYANQAFADCSPKYKMAVIKQLCGFPSACKKIFPREEETPEKMEDKTQNAQLEKKIESISTQAAQIEKKLQSTNDQVAQIEQSTKAKPAKEETKPDISLAYQLLCQAIKSLEGDGKEVNNSYLKTKMLTLNSSFNQSNYGFTQFNKFLLQAQEDKIVTLKATQRKGNYIVSCAKGAENQYN